MEMESHNSLDVNHSDWGAMSGECTNGIGVSRDADMVQYDNMPIQYCHSPPRIQTAGPAPAPASDTPSGPQAAALPPASPPTGWASPQTPTSPLTESLPREAEEEKEEKEGRGYRLVGIDTDDVFRFLRHYAEQLEGDIRGLNARVEALEWWVRVRGGGVGASMSTSAETGTRADTGTSADGGSSAHTDPYTAETLEELEEHECAYAYALGVENGFEQGQDVGYTVGYQEGYEDRCDEEDECEEGTGCEKDYERGYVNGSKRGEAVGYAEGYGGEFERGEEVGQREGCREGGDDEYGDGYEDGRREGEGRE
ncbi:hypothetical protein P154DRAFT_578452 [Amniculicola lignicola CBS 123094]|uniref:Uncharacterized protein n=1 Tax=Amniculicola lignicola CBS 123094 TaxID=1392246 RepID=A0A6A5WAJ6_9PLEO|nr:hypothetical protein P154DRAFT_578452 [Amniculicola lignicola CBS 123094]